jgi:gliding motility-associated-like protein
MNKKVLYVCLFLCQLFFNKLQATHNRAGEITYTRIAPTTSVVGGVLVEIYRYKITLTKYLDFGSNVAVRCVDTLNFGDGEKGIAPRVNGNTSCVCQNSNFPPQSLHCGEFITTGDPNYVVLKSIYEIEHTFPGPGRYLIRSTDPNRNYGVKNIPRSIDQPFYVESLLIINSFTGANSSPILKNDPIDKGCIGACFQHNPAAYDADGDSLSYELTKSRSALNVDVPGYTYPNAGTNATYSIDPIEGLLSWCNPTELGEFNIAFIIREWRKNTNGVYQEIGYVLRDMQVIITGVCDTPPILIAPIDTCVEAGTIIEKRILVTSNNVGHSISLEGKGGAFSGNLQQATLSNTQLTVTAPNNTLLSASFRWETSCNHIRQQPYFTTFKAIGKPADPTKTKLVVFANYNIRIIPPSIKNVTATPFGSAMKITWSLSSCNPSANRIVAYKVYRKNNCELFTHDPCSTTILPSSGFKLVGQTNNVTNNFLDTDNGNGLVVGQNYSYIVIAKYSDSTQTFGSTQVCVTLKRDVPVILNVDVLNTSTDNGSIFIRWTRPLTTEGNLDLAAFPGPYKFILKHIQDNNTPVAIFTTTGTTLMQLDTVYTHFGINTTIKAEYYIIEFMSGTVTVGSSQKASSVFLTTISNDRKVELQWATKTPWNNYKYTVKRKNPGTTTYTAIATTTEPSYLDKDKIVNDSTYCYQIISEGAYSDATIFNPLINNSQQQCALVKDKTAPCAPTLSLEADCPSGYIKVIWNDITKVCEESDDVVSYELYHRPTVTDEYTIRAIFKQGQDKEYITQGNALVSGCFAIAAIDPSGNRSKLSTDFCIDNCPIYELPNVFTPNNDRVNDNFQAVRVRQISEINLSVFDRWGNLVYKTNDPYFKWNGMSSVTNQEVSEGVFFYVCEVFEPRLRGITKRIIKGNVTMLR